MTLSQNFQKSDFFSLVTSVSILSIIIVLYLSALATRDSITDLPLMTSSFKFSPSFEPGSNWFQIRRELKVISFNLQKYKDNIHNTLYYFIQSDSYSRKAEKGVLSIARQNRVIIMDWTEPGILLKTPLGCFAC